MREYITTQGDTWDMISFNNYGSENFIDRLISANPDYRFITIFSGGIILNIPDIEDETKNNSKPPWKKGGES